MLSTQLPGETLRKDSMDVAPVDAVVAMQKQQSAVLARRHQNLAGSRDGIRIAPQIRNAATSRMTIKLLERMCTKHIEAVNSRDFYENGAIWFDKADTWEADIDFLHGKTMDLPQYVDTWKALARKWPDYGVQCDEMNTQVADSGTTAEITANIEITGMPAGSVRHSTCILSFELIEGKWLATKFRTLAG